MASEKRIKAGFNRADAIAPCGAPARGERLVTIKLIFRRPCVSNQIGRQVYRRSHTAVGMRPFGVRPDHVHAEKRAQARGLCRAELRAISLRSGRWISALAVLFTPVAHWSMPRNACTVQCPQTPIGGLDKIWIFLCRPILMLSIQNKKKIREALWRSEAQLRPGGRSCGRGRYLGLGPENRLNLLQQAVR